MSRPRLHIVADANIPFVEDAFGGLGTVVRVPGRSISAGSVRGADVLLVRSVTRVDGALLEGSGVRFVGSATIGTDHVDQAALARRGIAFAHAPGSNAESVVEWVLAAFLADAARSSRDLRAWTVGVVGCGQVGGRLVRRLPALGARVLACDPPLAEAAEAKGERHHFVPLPTVLREADVVTLHPPLTRTGRHPTYHLIGAEELRAMRPDALLLNASRGAVVDNQALAHALQSGALRAAGLDVWEGEPEPDAVLMARTALATPHIAGYSFDGKVAGTRMLREALGEWLGEPARWDASEALAASPEDRLELKPPEPTLSEAAWLDALVRQAYDIRADDARMRAALGASGADRGAAFAELRRAYPRRRSFHLFTLPGGGVPEGYRAAVTAGLGMQLG